MRGATVKSGSTTSKPSNGAGREFHNRVNRGLVACHTCHGAFTIAQVIDFEQFIGA